MRLHVCYNSARDRAEKLVATIDEKDAFHYSQRQRKEEVRRGAGEGRAG
jgi:hypothetical protein